MTVRLAALLGAILTAIGIGIFYVSASVVETLPPSFDASATLLLWLSLTMVGMLLIVLGTLTFYGTHIPGRVAQRKAVGEIKRLGGTATQCPNYEPRAGWASHVLSWLRTILGEDFFVVVNYVSLRGSNVTDTELGHLAALPELRSLDLDSTQITDAGLFYLRELTKLQELHLGGTRITDARLEHFQALTQLRVLRLGDTQVTDAGVAELQKSLPNCKIIR